MVSVIIPTYNGAHKIKGVLSGLMRQTNPDFEVIVVIDGSTDNTAEIVKSYASHFKNLRLVHQQNAGRSHVRNSGASQASGDILIFYDDDMEPQPDSVSRHADFHRNYVGILSGNQVEIEDQNKTDIQNYKAYLTVKWTAKYYEGINMLNYSNLFFTAANCSIKKDVFTALEGFDERLTDAEDYDLAYRAMEKNIDVFFDKSNRAIHTDPISCTSYIKRLREYAKAHNKLMQIHPCRNGRNKKKVSFKLKRFFYLFLAFPVWPRLIDKEITKVLPKTLRYRFYDIVIHALAIEYPYVPLWPEKK